MIRTSLALAILALPAFAQEQVDKLDIPKVGVLPVTGMGVRARVLKVTPEQPAARLDWRRGGEGLGGTVTRGRFTSADLLGDLPVGTWSAPLPVDTVFGKGRGWEFATVVVTPVAKGKAGELVESVEVELEFSEKGKPFKTVLEKSPKGATVGFAFPGMLLTAKGGSDPTFVEGIRGLSDYARLRRETLEKQFPEPMKPLKHFAIIGHIGGYGQGARGLGGGAGFGVRHCNPEMLVDEFKTMKMLGVNSLVGPPKLAEIAGMTADFRRMYWGGPGSGSPMSFFNRGPNVEDGCPFDPALKASILARVQTAIAEHKAVGAAESWALWWDEIGVAAKAHHQHCDRCRDEFRKYLQAGGVTPQEVGAQDWDHVSVYPAWESPDAPAEVKTKTKKAAPAPAPKTAADSLRFYWSQRLMTYATAKLFPEAAVEFKKAGIPLYAMQGPTPSWAGHSLDWHEFYDVGANTAFVWETSNRDARVWQWESYLADIARGIAGRHGMPIGTLIKPHRGAPQQRMLSLVARGARAIEWYTYGPDYSKGDSFSQRPDLLTSVAKAARFLSQAEVLLFDAKFAGKPEVAFVSPRSSEIWGRMKPAGNSPFEDAKWVYMALTHAHIPVDVISEQQLAEGKLEQYKAVYIVGPHLRRDSAAKVVEWVKAGGTLWTDALGLSRDEADQGAKAAVELFGSADRALDSFGSVRGYGAVGLDPFTETAFPNAAFTWDAKWGKGSASAAIAREPLAIDGEVLAKFADGKPALVKRIVGKGTVVVAGMWAGLTYSAKVRRADWDMSTDYDAGIRSLIAGAALDRGVYRPAVPSQPTVEAVMLDKAGKRTVALMNWTWRTQAAGGRTQVAFEKLRVTLPGAGDIKSVRSQLHGPLAIEMIDGVRTVVLPRLDEIDLLILSSD